MAPKPMLMVGLYAKTLLLGPQEPRDWIDGTLAKD
jgi:hypothetical protein